jgi:hypothetical protein
VSVVFVRKASFIGAIVFGECYDSREQPNQSSYEVYISRFTVQDGDSSTSLITRSRCFLAIGSSILRTNSIFPLRRIQTTNHHTLPTISRSIDTLSFSINRPTPITAAMKLDSSILATSKSDNRVATQSVEIFAVGSSLGAGVDLGVRAYYKFRGEGKGRSDQGKDDCAVHREC